MKRFSIALSLIFLLLPIFSFSQILDPVDWTTDVKLLKDGEVELRITAKIDAGWHLYAQHLDRDDGPVATEFAFERSKSYRLIGKVKEPKPKTEYDPNFAMDLNYFENKVTFIQKIEVLKEEELIVTGEVYYMVCDAEKCLPPETIDLKFEIPKLELPPKQIPEEELIDKEDFDKEALISESDSLLSGDSTIAESDTAETDTEQIYDPSRGEDTSESSLWAIFIAGFLGGLFVLFTPCVFPMIPLTVTFFTKQSKDKKRGVFNAFMYGIFIIVIYVSLGLLITIALGPDALNAMASNVWVNLIFFAIFFIFAISFLGAFEITLPNSWINKADEASDKKGLIGIFFMAFTLSLISFSCTAPVIGTLLVETAISGNYAGPAVGMAGFAVALALPFTLFAAFPAWLNSLPKSGGWLNSVKVVLGLLELALAMKFLSNVDLAYHWGILTREVFLAIWIVIFSLTGFYLLGKLKFSHDSDLPYISIPRILFSILFFSFVVYLIPGLFGAPLKLISGFPPPEHYNEGWTLGGGSNVAQAYSQDILDAGAHPEDCPHNLPCFHDYDEAFAYAEKVNKPVLVDFTGHSCVNCRKMEDNVWSDPAVLKMLQEDYILVSLYVDDKTDLPKEEQYVSETTGKDVETIGNRWSDLETRMFNTNSQPLYVLMSPQQEVLLPPVGYTPEISQYLAYLQQGLKNFEKIKENKNEK